MISYILIAVMWLLILNTARLFVRELINRRSEITEYREPSMLPNDFIIRDAIEDMFRPLLITIIAAVVVTFISINANWLRTWYSYVILIALILTFIISWFMATDRIIWWAKVEGNQMSISFVNLLFTFKRTLKIVDLEDIIANKRPNGNLELFESQEEGEPLYLFWVHSADLAYELMVDWLGDIIVATDENDSQIENESPEAELSVQNVVEEEGVLQEDVLQNNSPEEVVKKRGAYVTKWKLFRLSIREWTGIGIIIFIVGLIDIFLLDYYHNDGLWIAVIVILYLPVLLVTSALSFRGIRQIKRQESMFWFSFNEEMKKDDIRRFELKSGRHYDGENWFIAVRFGRIIAVRRDYIISISEEKKLFWQTRIRPKYKLTITGIDGKSITAVGDDFFVESLKIWLSGEEASIFGYTP